MASFDTNCLLRVLLCDIPRQTAKVDEILRRESHIEVADFAVVETVYVLEKSKGLPRDIIGDFVASIIYRDNIDCNRAFFAEVLPIYKKHPKLSFVDICLSVYARLNKAEPLLTFDRKLANQLKNAKEI